MQTKDNFLYNLIFQMAPCSHQCGEEYSDHDCRLQEEDIQSPAQKWPCYNQYRWHCSVWHKNPWWQCVWGKRDWDMALHFYSIVTRLSLITKQHRCERHSLLISVITCYVSFHVCKTEVLWLLLQKMRSCTQWIPWNANLMSIAHTVAFRFQI